MGRRIFDYIDLRHKRNVYAVGDIHGCFTDLENKLTEIGFDKELDSLISVGDLVDRGPESHLAVEYINQPWFHRVLGNHEDMAYEDRPDWKRDIPLLKRSNFFERLIDGPYLLQVETPKGLMIGFAHAYIESFDWAENRHNPNIETFTWTRGMKKRFANPDYCPHVKGVDKVFFGHNPQSVPQIRGNCHWIDTGSGKGGCLTVVNVETFGNIL